MVSQKGIGPIIPDQVECLFPLIELVLYGIFVHLIGMLIKNGPNTILSQN